MFSDPNYSFSVCQEKKIVIQSKVNIFHQIQPTYIVCILQDVEGCMTAAEISKQLNLQSLRSHKWQIQSCCALTGEG